MDTSSRAPRRRLILPAVVLGVLLFAAPVFSAVVTTATVPTGDTPSALAVNPVSHRVYSANYFGGSVSVLDGVTDLPLSTISIGRNLQVPNAVVVNSVSSPNRAYAANFWSSTLSVIDESSTTLTATVSVGGDHAGSAPRALALDPSGAVQKLYVAEYGSGVVSVWNAETYQLIKRIPVGYRPRGLGIFSSLDHKRIYALNGGSNSVSIIDGNTDTVIATVPVGTAPKAVAVDATTGWAWVTNEKSDSVTAINASDTVAGTIRVGVRPIGVAVDSANGRVFVANTASNNVSVIRTADRTNEATLGVGTGPWAVAIDSAGGRAFVSNFASDTVSVIDSALSVKSVDVGDGPYALAIDEGVTPSKIYVANRNADTVSVLADNGLASLALPGVSVAYAAPLPVGSIDSVAVELDAATGEHVITGVATSTRAFPAAILSLHADIDGAGVWRQAEIVNGSGTGTVQWRLRVPELASGTHTIRVRVLDQTSAACASSDGGSADKGATVSLIAAPAFQVGSSLSPKPGAACAKCHGTGSRGRRPNSPVGPSRCPQVKPKAK